MNICMIEKERLLKSMWDRFQEPTKTQILSITSWIL